MTIFPDSNIFLHFQSIDYINWRKLSGLNESVKIVIPLVVIQELDKHKYNHKGNIARMAQEASNKIEAWSAGNIKDDLSVSIDLHNTPKEIFTANRLDENHPDDRLLAAVLCYQQTNSAEQVFLCTNDTGPRLKAQALKIKTLKPNPADQVKPEAEAIDKENKELKKQLEKLKNLHPKLFLVFPGNERHYKATVSKPFEINEEFFVSEMEKIREEHPEIKIEDPYKNTALIISAFHLISNDDRQTYNQRLSKFYKAHEDYLRKLYQLNCKHDLSFELGVNLVNDGTCPADDVEVYMHFPDGT